MSKTDLRVRPIFHHTRDAIEAHLTFVLTALAVSWFVQDATGVSLKKFITSLRPLREFTCRAGGQDITFTPEVPKAVEDMLTALEKS